MKCNKYFAWILLYLTGASAAMAASAFDGKWHDNAPELGIAHDMIIDAHQVTIKNTFIFTVAETGPWDTEWNTKGAYYKISGVKNLCPEACGTLDEVRYLLVSQVPAVTDHEEKTIQLIYYAGETLPDAKKLGSDRHLGEIHPYGQAIVNGK